MDIHPTIDRIYNLILLNGPTSEDGFIPEGGMARLDEAGNIRIFISVEQPECIVIGFASDGSLVSCLDTEAAAFTEDESSYIDEFLVIIKKGQELLARVKKEIIDSEEFQSEPLPNNVIHLQPREIVSE